MAAALPNTQAQYQTWLDSQAKYQKQQLGGTGFLQALKDALVGADTQNSALRTQQQALTTQQFEAPTKYRQELVDSGITDPYKRQALIDSKLGNISGNLTGVQGKLADLGANRQGVVDTAGKAYDSQTAASLQEANSAGDFFKTLLGNDQSRENQLAQQQFSSAERAAQQKFSSRNDDLERRQMEASIAASNRSNRSGDGLSILDVLRLQSSDPLSAAGLKGYTRELAPNGGQGFWFYKTDSKTGKKTAVDVGEVANAIGGNRAGLLEGSNNPIDQAAIQQASGKSAVTSAAQNNADVLERSAIQIKAIGEAAKALNTSGPISSLFTGPYKKLQANRGTSEVAITLNQLGEGLIGNLARAVGGEKGVLTDQDIARARNLIPQVGEPATVTQTKLKNLDIYMNELRARANNTYGGSSNPAPQGQADPLGIR